MGIDYFSSYSSCSILCKKCFRSFFPPTLHWVLTSCLDWYTWLLYGYIWRFGETVTLCRVIGPTFLLCLNLSPWIQGVTWTYIRRSRLLVNVLYTSNLLYVSSELDHWWNLVSLTLFYRYYSDRCPSELAELLLYSCRLSTRYSERSHGISVSFSSCYRVVYVICAFPYTDILWNSLPVEYFLLNFCKKIALHYLYSDY